MPTYLLKLVATSKPPIALDESCYPFCNDCVVTEMYVLWKFHVYSDLSNIFCKQRNTEIENFNLLPINEQSNLFTETLGNNAIGEDRNLLFHG